jgi:RNA polymerase sigma factor (sigma-70 family)
VYASKATGAYTRRRRPVPEATTIDFELFFRQTYAPVVRSMVMIVGDRDLAGDLAQEAMARTLVAWDGFQDVEHARRFALRVAVNLATSRWRRERRVVPMESDVPAGWTSQTSDAIDDRMVLDGAIALLSGRQRACFALVDILGLAPGEAASALGMRPSTVRVHLTRARRRLATALAPTYKEEVER